MDIQRFKVKRDKYRSNRGGHSKFLNIYCEHCGDHILLYQKDGPGSLKRMYLDRILAPESLTGLQKQSEIPNLTCPKCNRLIAVLTTYEKEQRLAYSLHAYVIIKKSEKGIYPPEIANVLS